VYLHSKEVSILVQDLEWNGMIPWLVRLSWPVWHSLLILPLEWCTLGEVQSSHKFSHCILWQGFCEKVSNILSRWGVFKFYLSQFSVLLHKVVLDIYMLGSVMIFVIDSVCNWSQIVTINEYEFVNWKAYFVKEFTMPYGLCCSFCSVCQLAKSLGSWMSVTDLRS